MPFCIKLSSGRGQRASVDFSESVGKASMTQVETRLGIGVHVHWLKAVWGSSLSRWEACVQPEKN